MVLKKMEVGGWQFNVSTHREIFPVEAIEDGQSLLSRWVKVFPPEGTWVEDACGVPSLVVRLDCVVDNNGNLYIYEVEERPAGVGIASLINSQFSEMLKALLELWPPFYVVVSQKRIGSDDYLWRRVVPYDEALNDKGLLLVRAEPDEEEFYTFTKRSVAPIKHKGLKNYGVDLNLWRIVCSPEELPWNEAFVLKPPQGSKMRGVEIWHPDLRKEVKGVSTRKKIEETLRRYGTMYLQQFYPPMRREIMGQIFYIIYRVYFGYHPREKRYVCLGGVWNGRPNQLRIHGASDAVFGPLVLEQKT